MNKKRILFIMEGTGINNENGGTRMKKKIVGGIGIVCVAIIGFFMYQNSQVTETKTGKSVSVYKVEKQTPLHLKGQVQAMATQTVLLTADKGPVKTIHSKVGDHVAKNAVLVTYEWGEKIKAEREGIVSSLDLDAKNDVSKPLMIVKSTESEIKGTVTEYDKEKLSKDMAVTFDYVNQNKSVAGKITNIAEINNTTDSSASNNASKVVTYDFTAQPVEQIPLGYSVEILIPRDEIHLPTKSVQEKEGKFYVYSVKDEKAQATEITVKKEDGYYTLQNGLAEGAKIIKNVKGIKEGTEVTVQ